MDSMDSFWEHSIGEERLDGAPYDAPDPKFSMEILDDTVDGRNPAPPGRYETLWILGYLPYQLVQDFFHQPYHSLWIKVWLIMAHHLLGLGLGSVAQRSRSLTMLGVKRWVANAALFNDFLHIKTSVACEDIKPHLA